MKIDPNETKMLRQRHEWIVAKGEALQRASLEAEDALSALEDREARRATRNATAASELPFGGVR